LARRLNAPAFDAPARWRWPAAGDGPLIGLICLVIGVGLILWLDNVHLETTNGLWKSMDVDAWKANHRTAELRAPNYLYYPAMALLGNLLDGLGIFAGKTWKQLALINAAFAAIAVMIVHHLVRRLTGRRDLAAIAAIFQIGCGFFLVLAITNEDIMPSFTFMLGAMSAASLTFGAPTWRQVIGVGLLFTAGMLGEWRLLFPVLPPLLLALALSDGPALKRAGRILVLLLTVVGTCLLVVNRTEGHPGAVGLPDVLWTGKGINSGWSGFSIDKLWLLGAGMGEYWWGGRNFTWAGDLPNWMSEWLTSLAIQAALLALFLVFLWQQRADRRWRATAIVFLGTFVAGEVMNAYSQPQDPQMQINVMPWLALAWAIALAGRLRRPAAVLAAAMLGAAPLVYNVWAHAPQRGRDGRMQAAVAELERLSDPARTVFVYSGFEATVTWQFLLWGQRWEGVCDLGPAPLAVPKFKWISLFGSSVWHPEWTPAHHAEALSKQLQCAVDKGYRLIAGPIWAGSAEHLAEKMITLGGAKTAYAMHEVMRRDFDSRIILETSEEGPYSLLTPRPK
jgi:hypothetical protein